ncbi:MAG: triose-phosphate isomerase [Planctomycetaceae bacterium]|jgi:triosephosphate isomerase (TIM)|nr:triose-phosphate isomerase [Planctomycetaceae bacterium]MBT6488041.1 triose-phosphate isomerase [Planctomycetaceae bacterium]MBT6497819.1 triose-phosphate isomerase [Planctomycetaceae bacterium]
MRRYFIAGNWKMNLTRAAAEALATDLVAAMPAGDSPVDVLVAPASPYLLPVASVTAGSHVELGAQDAYFESAGAFTGEVSVEMLLDVGCTQVILGHSERRHVLGETDEFTGKKVEAALAGGLKVILCVGELLSEREAEETDSVLDRQMAGGLKNVDERAMENVVIAYEPVWAIGTGKTASPDQAESAHDHLRKWLANRYNSEVADRTRILYGGSVKPENASELLGQPNVDGALVGGASLKADLFNAIIEAAVELAGS